MILIHRIGFTLSVLLVAVSAFGQINQLELGKKHTLVKLHLKNDQIIKAKDFKLLNDSIVDFYHYLSGQHAQLKVLDIKSISEKRGSYAVTSGVIGAGIGLFSSLILEVDSPYRFGPKFGVTFALGGTLIGALLGTAFGASIPKWNSIEFSHKLTSYSIRISPNFEANSYGVGFKLSLSQHSVQ